MKEVVSAELMRLSDANTIKSGISGIELMHRAAMGVYNSVIWHGKVCIVCGSGNNAGDGYALALILNERGTECDIVLIKNRFSPDGEYYYKMCKERNIRILPLENCDFSAYDIVVDCIFGTGFKGEVRDIETEAISRINSSGAYVVSVDINSGLDADNGMYVCSIRSDITVSIGSVKSGHYLNMAKDMIGYLVNCDIGIALSDTPYYLIEHSDCASVFKKRKNFSNKGDYGYVALIGGCMEYSGAIKLSNLALSSLKTGAGVVKLASPRSLYGSVAPYLLESTFYPLSDNDGSIVFCRDEIDSLLKGVRAVALGMGMGSSLETYKVISHILKNYAITVIIDADGLNSLSKYGINILKETKCELILTPHPKELERLSGIATEKILASPIKTSLAFAKKYGCILLLKGASTVITDGESVYITDRGAPGMATAGSGDVLSGILLGICAQNNYKEEMMRNVAVGAYINGRAGELAQESINAVSMTASDTVRRIADAVCEIIN